MSLTKKNEEILRVYREANQHMFKLAGVTNKSLSDIQNIVINPRLRKSQDVNSYKRSTGYGRFFGGQMQYDSNIKDNTVLP